MSNSPTIYQIVDGSAIFTRVMKGTEDLHSDGLNNCLSVLKQYDKAPPYNTILVFDKENNGMGRRQMSSDYKPISDDIEKKAEKHSRYKFLGKCQELFASLGYTVCMPKKLKADADDLVALLANAISKTNPCLIYTQDRDLLQLQNDRCAVFNFDVAPLQDTAPWNSSLTTLRKSIVGKPNETKGVQGMGKTAFQKLYDAYGEDGLQELEAIAKGIAPKSVLMQACEENPSDKILGKLLNNYAAWRSSYLVAQLHPEWLTHGKDRGIEWIKRVPMANTLSTGHHLAALGVQMSSEDKRKYLTNAVLPIEAEAGRATAFLEGNDEGLVALDYESYDTNNIEWHVDNFVSAIDQEVTGGSWCGGYNLNNVIYIPTAHAGEGNWTKKGFTDFVSDQMAKKTHIIHNFTFEYVVSRHSLGIPAETFKAKEFYDTASISSLIKHNESAGLKSQSYTYLNYLQTSYSDTLEAFGVDSMKGLTAQEVFQYGIDDALVTAHLFVLQRIKAFVLEQTDLLQDTIPAQIELAESYIEGTLANWDTLKTLTEDAEAVLAETMPLIREGLLNLAPDVSEERASKFFEVVREDLIAINAFKGVDSDKTAEQLSRLYQSILTNTQYVEYSEEEVPVSVIPTTTFMATVMPAVGLDVPEKMSKKYLYDTYFGKGETVEQDKFITAMLEATASFKAGARSGAEWDIFEKLCLKYTTKEPTMKASGFECSLSSPKQKQYILYAMMGLPVRMRSKPSLNSARALARVPGSPATDDKAISLALSVDVKGDVDKEDLLHNILKYTTAQTKLSLFFYPWQKWKHADGRMRPQFRTNHTLTRRPGGSAPNFLQLPGKGGIRDVFYAGKGRCYLSIDFSNQELRIMADVTRDEGLMSCYVGDDQKNIHTLTSTAIAEKVYGGYFPHVLKDMVTETMDRGGHTREVQSYDQFMSWYKGKEGQEKADAASFCRSKRAKACNFTVAFGGTGHALSGNILVPLEEADIYIEDIHIMYPRIKEGQDATEEELFQNRFVTNAYGAIYEPNPQMFRTKALRSKAARTGFNFKMQGTAAHVLYQTFDRFNDREVRERYDCKIFYPIYDEIVINAPDDPELLMELCKEIHECMYIIPPTHEIPQIAEFTLHPNLLETGTELGEIADVSIDKIKEILHA